MANKSAATPTPNEDHMLTSQDARYYAIKPHGGGQMIFASAEALWKGETDVYFPFPSQPALFLSLARRAFEAIAAVDQRGLFVPWHGTLTARNPTQLFDYFESLMSHVVFSFNAIEAFANWKIPEDYVHITERKGMQVSWQKTEVLERSTIEEKLTVILPKVLDVKSPKGTRIWERFIELKRIRDRVTHPKPSDYTPTKHGVKATTLWGMMMRQHATPHCDHAHDLIGHFGAPHRWFRQYPLRIVETRDITEE
jgi:hypothetical protein